MRLYSVLEDHSLARISASLRTFVPFPSIPQGLSDNPTVSVYLAAAGETTTCVEEVLLSPLASGHSALCKTGLLCWT